MALRFLIMMVAYGLQEMAIKHIMRQFYAFKRVMSMRSPACSKFFYLISCENNYGYWQINFLCVGDRKKKHRHSCRFRYSYGCFIRPISRLLMIYKSANIIRFVYDSMPRYQARPAGMSKGVAASMTEARMH